MVNEIMEDMLDSFGKVMKVLQKDLSRTRTGRANLSILDPVRVEYYGSPMPLSQVASLAIADPRLITVKPWDKGLLHAIEKAIIQVDIGITPSSDGEIIRLPIPPLSGERRQEMVKLVKRHGEDARVAIRNLRRDTNEMLKELEDLPEDDLHRTLKKVQENTDEFIKKVDEAVTAKEKEILEF